MCNELPGLDTETLAPKMGDNKTGEMAQPFRALGAESQVLFPAPAWPLTTLCKPQLQVGCPLLPLKGTRHSLGT